MLVISIYGCGSKEKSSDESPTPSPTESVEEVTEEVVVAEPVDDVVVEPEVATLVTSEIDLDAFEEDEAKDHHFGDIGYVAQYRDIRETTGKNSDATADVWGYLTYDGLVDTENMDELWEYGVTSYTGRWAYPTLLESEATKDLYLYDWTDSFCSYIADEGETKNAILICTGFDVFNMYTSGAEDVEYKFEPYRTFDVNGQEIEVYSVSDNESSITYLYKLGGFTVVIEFMDDENAGDDLLLEFMEDIVLY